MTDFAEGFEEQIGALGPDRDALGRPLVVSGDPVLGPLSQDTGRKKLGERPGDWRRDAYKGVEIDKKNGRPLAVDHGDLARSLSPQSPAIQAKSSMPCTFNP